MVASAVDVLPAGTAAKVSAGHVSAANDRAVLSGVRLFALARLSELQLAAHYQCAARAAVYNRGPMRGFVLLRIE